MSSCHHVMADRCILFVWIAFSFSVDLFVLTGEFQYMMTEAPDYIHCWRFWVWILSTSFCALFQYIHTHYKNHHETTSTSQVVFQRLATVDWFTIIYTSPEHPESLTFAQWLCPLASLSTWDCPLKQGETWDINLKSLRYPSMWDNLQQEKVSHQYRSSNRSSAWYSTYMSFVASGQNLKNQQTSDTILNYRVCGVRGIWIIDLNWIFNLHELTWYFLFLKSCLRMFVRTRGQSRELSVLMPPI